MLKFDFEIYGVLMEVLFEILDVNYMYRGETCMK